MSPRSKPFAIALGCALSVAFSAACGGERGPRSAADAEDESSSNGSSGSELETSAEIGALDEARVDQTFRSSLNGLQRCLNRGAERVEFLGGGVSFYIEVDKSGN